MNEVIDFRIEAEYFLKKFLKIDDILSKIKTVEFIKAAKPVNGRAYDSESFNCDDGIFISKIGDVTNKRQIKTWEKVTNQEFVRQKGKLLKDNAILMTLTGDPPDVGKVNLINCKDIKCTWNQRVAKIVLDKNIYLSNNILYAVLSCELIRRQMERFAKGIRQRNLGNDCFKYVLLPLFSMEFQKLLDFSVSKHKNMLVLSQEKYTKAENLFVSELGLENFNPPSEKVSIKTLKESFLKTGRLDSQYYQVKYDEYLQKIKLNKHTTIGNEFGLIKEKMKSGLGIYNYVEIGDVNVSDGKSSPKLIDEKDLPANAKILPQKGDLLVSKVRPNRGAVSIIEEDYSNLVVSGAFTVLREKKESDYRVETLKTLLRTPIYLDWLLKFNVGTSYPVITDEDILSLPIPIIKSNVQDEIASYIKQSMEYSKKAKELLNISTKAVEIAIDKDEETAHNFLDRQTDRQTLIAYYNAQASYFINLAVFRLYEELGLFDSLKSANCTVKNLKDTFGISGRLDSEYYQEKYDRLFEKLSDNNCDKLSNLVTIKKSIEPGSKSYQTKGTPFIRVQDLTKFGLTDTSIYLSENEFKDCIRPKKDTILLSKDGTVGIAYKMNKDEDIITSSAILHLDVKDERVLSDYLTLVLNSLAVKMQAEKDAGGSIINHWKKSEIENVIIPIIAKEKQEQISGLLIESENLRSESKSILQKAVKSVEMAIEYGENKAITYLNS